MRELRLVTGNMHKLQEFQHGLGQLGITVSLLKADCDEVQADTLEEVVRSCLDQIADQGHEDFILDDSGLFVHALNGFPGVYSSYVFSTIGNDGILKLLNGSEDRTAHFECCIGCHLCGERIIVTGRSSGEITMGPRGSDGFGYDPVFQPDGAQRTFAEMGLEEKGRYSHRGDAMRHFVAELDKRMGRNNR
ncbi:MAG: Non-canonical purine NTP pyrophosphatase [Methanomassiliicoccales archaeon PtaU1.Bin124]|nr:MAG: Non-canonical purine NTP pyrophosphatase [Methanomassiliicoccales archaeon PtaU1.Bin124]